MAIGYNPYRQQVNSIMDRMTTEDTAFNSRLARLSKLNRSYDLNIVKSAKGIHNDEDLSISDTNNPYGYSLFSRKIYAMMQEKQTIASLSVDYKLKLPILREYATKGEIRDYVSKMTNEIIVYGESDKKFCELKDLNDTLDIKIKQKSKKIFESVYSKLGFSDMSYGWDVVRDWLVEGYVCREIIYDKRGKNIIGFQKIDPESVIPIVDPESGVKIWIQHAYDEENRRVLLDSELIYISYSGSSNYMETSYVEPLIRPYNELKSLERTRILFNIINATMHKEFVIPTNGLSPTQAEQEVAIMIADYKDHISFDDTTGDVYIDGQKNLPYSKEYWFPSTTDGRPEMNIVNPEGHDLNENSMLIWFRNNFKYASKFPLSRLDNTTGGGNIFNVGGDVTYDDYNFTQYIQRLRTIFKEIIIKPIYLQLCLDFPELEENIEFYNDLDIEYYGHSEIIKTKNLSNMQAKSTIAADLMNNLKKMDKEGNEIPVLHWKYVLINVMEFSEEMIEENDRYWKEDSGAVSTTEGGGDLGGDGADLGGDDLDMGGDDAQPVDEEPLE